MAPAQAGQWVKFGRVMPAYAIYLRHVEGVTFKDVRTTLGKANQQFSPEKFFWILSETSRKKMATESYFQDSIKLMQFANS